MLSERHTCGGATGNYIDDWFRGAVAGNTWVAANRFQQPGADWIEQPVTFRRLRTDAVTTRIVGAPSA